MSSVSEFNETLLQLVNEMKKALPQSTELETLYSLLSTLFSTNKENTLVYSTFCKHAKENRDGGDMVEFFKQIIPLPHLVDNVWPRLTDENRKVVIEYVTHLLETVHDEETNIAPESSQAIFMIYNTTWKDLLTLLGFQEITDKIQRLLDVKGADSDILFQIMSSVMDHIIPSEIDLFNESEVMAMLMPSENQDLNIEEDICKVGQMKFPFENALKMEDFLLLLKEDSKKALYWHYLKIMTNVVENCPAEICEMMNHMLSGCELFK